MLDEEVPTFGELAAEHLRDARHDPAPTTWGDRKGLLEEGGKITARLGGLRIDRVARNELLRYWQDDLVHCLPKIDSCRATQRAVAGVVGRAERSPPTTVFAGKQVVPDSLRREFLEDVASDQVVAGRVRMRI